jgi:hypothetical protein
MKAGQEHLKEGMLAKSAAHHERMMARMDTQIEKMEAVVDVFEERLHKMDTKDLEGKQEKLEYIAEQQDDPSGRGLSQNYRSTAGPIW